MMVKAVPPLAHIRCFESDATETRLTRRPCQVTRCAQLVHRRVQYLKRNRIVVADRLQQLEERCHVHPDNVRLRAHKLLYV